MRQLEFRAWDKSEKRFIDLNGFDTVFGSFSDKGKIIKIYEQGKIVLIQDMVINLIITMVLLHILNMCTSYRIYTLH
jgi:hypothetical protein